MSDVQLNYEDERRSRQIRQMTSRERKELIRQKEKELNELRKEDFVQGLKENRWRIILAAERFFIMVVSLICFILHGVSPPEEESDTMLDRSLEPMAYGGDMLLQAGLFVACAAFIYVQVFLLLIIDVTTALLLILAFFISWPESFRGLALALYIFVLLDIILHTLIVAQEIYRIKTRKHRKSQWPSTRSSGRGSSDTRKDRGSSYEPHRYGPGVSFKGVPRDTVDSTSDALDRRSRVSSRSSRPSRQSFSPRTKKVSLLSMAKDRLAPGETSSRESRPPKKSLMTLAKEKDTSSSSKSQSGSEKPKPKDKKRSLLSIARQASEPRKPSSMPDPASMSDSRKASTPAGTPKQSATEPPRSSEARKTTPSTDAPKVSIQETPKQSVKTDTPKHSADSAKSSSTDSSKPPSDQPKHSAASMESRKQSAPPETPKQSTSAEPKKSAAGIEAPKPSIDSRRPSSADASSQRKSTRSSQRRSSLARQEASSGSSDEKAGPLRSSKRHSSTKRR